MKEKIKCLICGEQTNYTYNNFTAYHLRKCHNINAKEYYDMFFKKDGEGICPVCGKETKFENIKDGYRHHCCVKCARNDPKIVKILQQKRKEYENSLTSEAWEDKIKKWKNTISQKTQEDWNDIAEKYRKTMSFKTEEELIVSEQKRKISRIKSYVEKIKDRLKNNNLEYVKYDFEKSEFVLKCLKCGSIFNMKNTFLQNRMRYNIEVCIICNPHKSGFSSPEKKLLYFVKENYDKEILENDRNVLVNRELDIYLPNEKLAIEYNGLFWHSDQNKPKEYHKDKTIQAENENIHLLQVYEDDWEFKKDIVKSNILKILDRCGKMDSNNLELREINYKSAIRFLKQNSLYNDKDFDLSFGLFEDKKLLYVVSFKTIESNNFVLVDYCDILNYKINGALDRILKYFVNKYNPNQIIKFADRSWTYKNNSEFLKVGFEIENEIEEDFKYILRKIRYNKNDEKVVKTLSEKQLYKIYDSGQLKFVYKR